MCSALLCDELLLGQPLSPHCCGWQRANSLPRPRFLGCLSAGAPEISAHCCCCPPGVARHERRAERNLQIRERKKIPNQKRAFFSPPRNQFARRQFKELLNPEHNPHSPGFKVSQWSLLFVSPSVGAQHITPMMDDFPCSGQGKTRVGSMVMHHCPTPLLCCYTF